MEHDTSINETMMDDSPSIISVVVETATLLPNKNDTSIMMETTNTTQDQNDRIDDATALLQDKNESTIVVETTNTAQESNDDDDASSSSTSSDSETTTSDSASSSKASLDDGGDDDDIDNTIAMDDNGIQDEQDVVMVSSTTPLSMETSNLLSSHPPEPEDVMDLEPTAPTDDAANTILNNDPQHTATMPVPALLTQPLSDEDDEEIQVNSFLQPIQLKPSPKIEVQFDDNTKNATTKNNVRNLDDDDDNESTTSSSSSSSSSSSTTNTTTSDGTTSSSSSSSSSASSSTESSSVSAVPKDGAPSKVTQSQLDHKSEIATQGNPKTTSGDVTGEEAAASISPNHGGLTNFKRKPLLSPDRKIVITRNV